MEAEKPEETALVALRDDGSLDWLVAGRWVKWMDGGIF